MTQTYLQELIKNYRYNTVLATGCPMSAVWPLPAPCPALWRDQYSRHGAAVRQLVPAEQLLVYR